MTATSKNSSGKQVKYFADQFDDEEVLMVFRRHPVVMRKGLVVASIGVLLPVLYVFVLTFIPSRIPSIGFFMGAVASGFLLGALLMWPSWIAWYYSVFIVTDQRFIQITQKGFFHRSVVDIALHQVQMVNYEIAGFQETMLGFGTIMVQTYMGELVIKDVHHPAAIQKELVQILRERGIITNPAALADSEELLT